jgi:amino acid transporter
MSADHGALGQHPAPHRGRVGRTNAAFGVIAGPAAWFIELCGGYALASAQCYSQADRTLEPLSRAAWTWPAMIALLIACVLVALAAVVVSARTFARTRAESGGDYKHLMEVGAGRTRFLALWGVLLGAGFALATALTAVAFVVVPRCAG